jgi:hypothetical protein
VGPAQEGLLSGASAAAPLPTASGWARSWRRPTTIASSSLRLAGLGPRRLGGPVLRPLADPRPAGLGLGLAAEAAVLASDLLEPVAGGAGGLL